MIIIISAITLNNAIGKDNKLLFKLKGDLSNFKDMTTSQTVIMGKSTYLSLKKPLENRRNIIISSTLKDEKVDIYNNLYEAIKSSNTEHTFLIGGTNIYKEGLEYATHMVLTHIHEVKNNADTFFPNVDFSKWKIINSTKFNEKEINYTIAVYEKIK